MMLFQPLTKVFTGRQGGFFLWADDCIRLGWAAWIRMVLLGVMLVLVSGGVVAQSLRVSGYVVARETGEVLPGASVYERGRAQGVYANGYGYFSLSVVAGDSLRLRIWYSGYTPLEIQVLMTQDTVLRIGLEALTLSEIAIVAPPEGLPPISAMAMPIEELIRVPALLGEKDILKALALTPGVSLGLEGSSGLRVRGGNPDQNLILLDGAKVYNVSHLLGLFSVFNADALQTLTLYKGYFPARYGGRTGAVLDVRMREGRTDTLHGEAGVGLLSSRLTLEGPIRSEKTSFLVAARAGYLALLASPLYFLYRRGATDQYTNYLLYDFSAKVNHQLAGGGRWYLSAYTSQDRLISQETGTGSSTSASYLGWINQTLSIRYAKPIRDRVFMSAQSTYTRYRYQSDMRSRYQPAGRDTAEVQQAVSASAVSEADVQVQADIYPASWWHWQVGMMGNAQVFTPLDQYERDQGQLIFEADTVLSAWQGAGWLDMGLNRGPLRLGLGLRGTAFKVRDTAFAYLEPRVDLTLSLGRSLRWSVGWGRTVQPVHLFTATSIGLPGDVWIPASRQFGPQVATQVATGLTGSWGQGSWRWSLEGYLRQVRNLIQYQAPYIDLGYVFFDRGLTAVKQGRGQAYGVEAFLHTRQRQFSGWLSYTLGWSYVWFDGAQRTVSLLDQRHNLSLTGVRPLSAAWTLTATWTYQSGRWAYPPIATYPTPDGEMIYVYADTPKRLPAYHRMDIGFEKKVTTRRRGREAVWRLGAYNVYNRSNPLYVSVKPASGTEPGTVSTRSFLPFLPYLDYSWKF